MQLLYGSDRTNYRTLAKSAELNPRVETYLKNYILNYDFVTFDDRYSSILDQPHNYVYISTDFNGASGNSIVVGDNGRMAGVGAPSSYLHAIINEVDNEFYKKDFFEIFNYRFIEASAVADYDDNIDDFRYRKQKKEIKKVLTNEQLIYILGSFMINDRTGRKTKIIVDETGDQYSSRAMEVLANLYLYLPFEWRKKYGFSSFSKKGNVPGTIAFIIYCPNEIEDRDGNMIDLSQKDYPINVRNINSRYFEFAKYIVEMTDEKRDQYFESLSKTLTKNGRLNIEECINYFNDYGKWDDENASFEDYLEEWINFIYNNRGRKGNLFEKLVSIINKKIDENANANQYYNAYLFNMLKSKNEKIDRLSVSADRIISFADEIDHLHIDQELFHEWYIAGYEERKQNYKLDNEISRNQFLKKEEVILQNVTNKSKKFGEMISIEKDRLNGKIDESNMGLEKKKEEERNRIRLAFEKLKDSDHINLSKINEIEKNIQFIDDNKEVFLGQLYEYILNLIPNIISFDFLKSLGSLWEYVTVRLDNQKLDEIKEHISYNLDYQRNITTFEQLEVYKKEISHYIHFYTNEMYNKILNYIIEIENGLKKEFESRIFELSNKGDILDTYYDIRKQQEMGILKDEDMLQIIIVNGKVKYKVDIRVDQLMNIIHFTLIPDDRSQFDEDILIYMWMLDPINEMHLKYILKMPKISAEFKARFIVKSLNTIRPFYISKELKQLNEKEVNDIISILNNNETKTKGLKKLLSYFIKEDSSEDEKKSKKNTNDAWSFFQKRGKS